MPKRIYLKKNMNKDNIIQRMEANEAAAGDASWRKTANMLAFAAASLPVILLICEYGLKPLWHLIIAR